MGVLILPELLDTSYAVSLSELLKKKDTDFILDGRQVVRVGGLCFQLLVSAYLTARSNGGGFEIRDVSDEMKENLLLMGGDFLLHAGDEA